MPYRPSQWTGSPLTSITTSTVDASGNQSSSVYVFDAILRSDHHESVQPTMYPIQSGAAMTDHSFVMPSDLVLEIGESDVMDSFTSGQFSSSPSKSVGAYETLQSIRTSRIPVTVTTRLKNYTNMLLVDMAAPDDVKTRFGLRVRVRFHEIFTGTVAVAVNSARPSATAVTPGTTAATKPVSSTVTKDYNTSNVVTVDPTNTSNVPPPAAPAGLQGPPVEGAGEWSSLKWGS
jgi:hypothetical protein